MSIKTHKYVCIYIFYMYIHMYFNEIELFHTYGTKTCICYLTQTHKNCIKFFLINQKYGCTQLLFLLLKI